MEDSSYLETNFKNIKEFNEYAVSLEILHSKIEELSEDEKAKVYVEIIDSYEEVLSSIYTLGYPQDDLIKYFTIIIKYCVCLYKLDVEEYYEYLLLATAILETIERKYQQYFICPDNEFKMLELLFLKKKIEYYATNMAYDEIADSGLSVIVELLSKISHISIQTDNVSNVNSNVSSNVNPDVNPNENPNINPNINTDETSDENLDENSDDVQ